MQLLLRPFNRKKLQQLVIGIAREVLVAVALARGGNTLIVIPTPSESLRAITSMVQNTMELLPFLQHLVVIVGTSKNVDPVLKLLELLISQGRTIPPLSS